MQERFNFGGIDPMHVVDTTLAPPPVLTGIDRLAIDTETTNEKNVWERTLVGISYRLPDGRKSYLPLRHPGGGNYDEAVVKRWAREQLRDKTFVCANAKHEADTFYRWDVDLEEQNCQPADVFNQAALLNDHRYRLNLDLIAQEELGRKKVDLGNAKDYPIHERPVDEIAPYAIEDAVLAWELDQAYAPKIAAEELGNVLQLENDITYAICEMERNGTFLDVETLYRWDTELTCEAEQRILQIHKNTGLRINPNSGDDMAELFGYLHLPFPRTALGAPSFAENFLETVGHPDALLALEARQLLSMHSKYVKKYKNAVEPSGRLRYALHQLRGDEYGTITGRFSSSNVNIQQVAKNSKQPKLLQRWPIRSLFVPPPGRVWASADASQIEFRIFAHYAAQHISDRLLQAYRSDPRTDFHAFVVQLTGLIRDFAKNVNFAKLYGGGAKKVAFMCGVPEDEGERIVRQYDRKFPESKRLIQIAADQAERIGYVRTFLGRRRRYLKEHGDTRFYSALNSVFQGTAADIMKQKILEVYRERKELGLTLRFTVHDELDGDLPSAEALPAWQTVLNRQTSGLLTPILWETNTGKNWHQAH